MSHSVLLVDFDPANLEPLSKPVADAYGFSPADARLRMRQGWGFLEWDSPPQRANAIAGALNHAGARAQVFENSSLRQPGETAVMSGFALSPDGFLPELRAPYGTPRTIPWIEISIVAAGGFSEEIVAGAAVEGQGKAVGLINMGILLATGIPAGLLQVRRKKKEKKPKSNTLFISFGQLTTANNESFFFNADTVSFAGLGEAKQMSSAQNYRTLIALLAQRSSARLNMGARGPFELTPSLVGAGARQGGAQGLCAAHPRRPVQ